MTINHQTNMNIAIKLVKTNLDSYVYAVLNLDIVPAFNQLYQHKESVSEVLMENIKR